MTKFPEIATPTFVNDPENASDFDAKHCAFIGIDVVDDIANVTLTAGYYVAHPNEPGHFFEWLMLLVDDQPLAHFVGTPEVLNPTFTTEVNLPAGTKLTALAHCNLHGTFRTEAVI
jgi:superoxide reductase